MKTSVSHCRKSSTYTSGLSDCFLYVYSATINVREHISFQYFVPSSSSSTLLAKCFLQPPFHSGSLLFNCCLAPPPPSVLRHSHFCQHAPCFCSFIFQSLLGICIAFMYPSTICLTPATYFTQTATSLHAA